MSISRDYFDSRIDEIVERIDTLNENIERLTLGTSVDSVKRYDYKQSSYILNISIRQLMRLKADGDIKSHKYNGRIYFLLEDLNEYINQSLNNENI